MVDQNGGAPVLRDLQLSETYHRSKRNLLAVASVSIVLWLAAPKTVNIPGLDQASSLSLVKGCGTLLISLTYLFVSWWLQYRAVLAINSEAAAAASSETSEGVLRRLNDKAAEVVAVSEELARRMTFYRDSIEELIERTSKNVDLIDRARIDAIIDRLPDFAFDGRTLSQGRVQEPDDRESMIRRLERHLTQAVAGSQAQILADHQAAREQYAMKVGDPRSILTPVNRWIELIEAHNKAFSHLSKLIDRHQRISIRFLDGAACYLMSVVAFLALVDGLSGFRITLAIRDWFIHLVR